MSLTDEEIMVALGPLFSDDALEIARWAYDRALDEAAKRAETVASNRNREGECTCGSDAALDVADVVRALKHTEAS